MAANKKTAKKKSIKKAKAKKTLKKRAAPKRALKRAVKRPAKKAAAKTRAAKIKAAAVPVEPKLAWRTALPEESFLGTVDDYFGHIGVIALTLQSPLAVGETIHVRGHTTDITEAVSSMQLDHQDVSSAVAGQSVGIKIVGKCRKSDYVYKKA